MFIHWISSVAWWLVGAIQWIIYRWTCRSDNFFQFHGTKTSDSTHITCVCSISTFLPVKQSMKSLIRWITELFSRSGCWQVSWFTDTQVKSDKFDGWQLSLVSKLAVYICVDLLAGHFGVFIRAAMSSRSWFCVLLTPEFKLHGDLAAIWWQDHWRTTSERSFPLLCRCFYEAF